MTPKSAKIAGYAVAGAEPVPPTYRLHYLIVGSGKEVNPRFPIQILPSQGSDIKFRWWGSEHYDIHTTFAQMCEDQRVRSIHYCICYDKVENNFVHSFDTLVIMTTNGIASRKTVIMKPYRSLDDMPALPHDWTYFQFVG